ncbi:hypothetical protein K461DRAFT_266205 [Myriangium duriaei CBS 260.36]|uniref:BZIP domain-containing protein n=1 Tax=Myriangium duriaei CBS 260.36 TaxID=1168546 RepID=A0A9P4J9M9_9PEZI|nr:hypothetical protein K461DRAFT_266205 [Myriangium duriaei CBS 260.36]
MADQNPYPYPSPTTQLEQLAGAAQQAQSPTAADFTPTQQRPPNPRKRRADGSSVSARGVANLTPEQLAKKRANDRDAQRAIRERTRANIENLERRIKELEGQQPFQELQSVVRSRDAVIAENEELKKRLQSIAALAQFQPGGHGLNDLALATSQQAPLPLPGQQPQTQQQEQQHQSSYHQDYTHDEDDSQSISQQHIHPDLRSLQSHHAPTAPMQMSNGSTPTDHQTPTQHVKSDLPEWQRIPSHFTPGQTELDDLDTALQDLLSTSRQALDSVLGPAQPSFAALVAPSFDQQTPSLSIEIVQLIHHHLGTSDLPKRVAMMYILYLLLQWIASPSQTTFERLPDWLRPTEQQIERPHAVWVDLLPWPQSRDRVLAAPAQHGTGYFYSTFSSLNLSWPYDPELCLMKTSPAEGPEDWVINPVFEAHLRDLDHWTLVQNTEVRDGRDEGLEGLLQGLGSGETQG